MKPLSRLTKSGPLADLKSFVRPLVEFRHAGAGSASEDKDGPSDRMADLALLELTVLHGRQEIAQPAERCFSQGGVELIPEYQRKLPTQANIPHLVEGRY